ncbi:MAG TPA: hypothetical protein VF214_03860 [Edaphobacter sp.]
MDDKSAMLKHFLAALAYRTQKALRDAPEGFADFSAGMKVRTPHELVRHMDSVLGYARTHFVGGSYRPRMYAEFKDSIRDFHSVLEDLAKHLEAGTEFLDTTPERMLQGPFSDAMTHAGQLAMLRRLAGCPVPPENFIVAKISSENLGPDQPQPASPDKEWPEKL